MSDIPRLRITEIFYSLQGEAKTIGYPTLFIRLTGCPLRCQYCDSAYAFQGGNWWSVDEIISKVNEYEPSYITVTGGEPLAQKNCLLLLQRLCDLGANVSLETSGAMSIQAVDGRVSRVVDVKTPGSGESDKNHWQNIEFLSANDQVKFVICNEDDYLWAKNVLQEYSFPKGCEILFSPSSGQLSVTELADWIVRDRLTVRFQIQLHKLLWGDEPGR